MVLARLSSAPISSEGFEVLTAPLYEKPRAECQLITAAKFHKRLERFLPDVRSLLPALLLGAGIHLLFVEFLGDLAYGIGNVLAVAQALEVIDQKVLD